MERPEEALTRVVLLTPYKVYTLPSMALFLVGILVRLVAVLIPGGVVNIVVLTLSIISICPLSY